MLKRLLWLLLFVMLGVFAWVWLRLRQDDRASVDSQLALLDSAPQTAPSRGSTTSANLSDAPPPSAGTPIIRAPFAEPTPQEVNPSSDAPGEVPTQLENSAAPPEATMETPPAPMADDESDENGITAYCVRCHEKRAMVDPHEETTENGRRAARGTCPECGANMFTFLPEA
jgi:cytochrome c553